MTTTETAVKMVLDRWEASIKNCDNLLSTLTDEILEKEIAPGRNRGIYVLGHLIAVHDAMLILLDMGGKMYPELEEPFLTSPDRAIIPIPSVATLRDFWSRQNEAIRQKYNALTTSQWFEKHTAVSAGDFAAEPHRNKLNIIITRTSHLQYHSGQLALLK